MNTHVTGWIKTGERAKATYFKEWHKLTGQPPPGKIDDEATLANLPIWQRTSTVLAAKYVSPTGAAILSKLAIAAAASPRVPAWRKLLKEINWEKHGFVYHFLADVILWHHFSTNGRFNEEIGRFERWGVRSVSDWHMMHAFKAPNPGYKSHSFLAVFGGSHTYGHVVEKWQKLYQRPMVSRRAFLRIKDRLIGMGLIEAHAYLWNGKTTLWIKPTQELCRIVFDEGYWEKVTTKYAFTATKKQPRGIHVAKAKNGAPGSTKLTPQYPKNGTSLPPVENP